MSESTPNDAASEAKSTVKTRTRTGPGQDFSGSLRHYENVRLLQKHGLHLCQEHSDGTKTHCLEDTLIPGDIKPMEYFQKKGLDLDATKYHICNMDTQNPPDFCITRPYECTWQRLRNIAKQLKKDSNYVYSNPFIDINHVGVADRRIFFNDCTTAERGDGDIQYHFTYFAGTNMVVALWIPSYWTEMEPDKLITSPPPRHPQEMMFLGYWYCHTKRNMQDHVPGSNYQEKYAGEIYFPGVEETYWSNIHNELLLLRPLYHSGKRDEQGNEIVAPCPPPAYLFDRSHKSNPFVISDDETITATYTETNETETVDLLEGHRGVFQDGPISFPIEVTSFKSNVDIAKEWLEKEISEGNRIR